MSGYVDDGDWDDQPYDDSEYTEADEAQMRKGLADVKARIPEWKAHFTHKDAEDALWDSYYDVNKAVAHLRKRFVPKQQQQQQRQPPPPPPSKQPAGSKAHGRGGASSAPGSKKDGGAASSPHTTASSTTASSSTTTTTAASTIPTTTAATTATTATVKGEDLSAEPAPKDGAAPTASIAGKMASLQITEQPHKGKQVDVIEMYQRDMKEPGYKRHASFVVVGHIDAGKSTLMGRLLLDLGCVDNHTVEKFRKEAAIMGKESFALAWVLDTFAEERARGVTIDVAMRDFETEQTRFTILDAPGHRDFVPNMIAGASRADFGVVVVDGNTGAFEKGLKGQTHEHIVLLRSFGVQRLVVAVNKLDMVGWSRERFDEIADQIGAYVSQIGFRTDQVAFVPISGLRGHNVVAKSADTAAGWYTGPTLAEALEAAAAAAAEARILARDLYRPLRLAVSETYRSDKGDRVVCGRLGSGTIQVGEHVAVLPSGGAGHVRGILVGQRERQWAVAGENAEIWFATAGGSSAGGGGVDFDRVAWGDVVCPSGAPAHVADTFTLRGLALDHLLPMPVEVHHGRLGGDGQIVSMPALLDKTTGGVTRRRPRQLRPGSYALIRIRTARLVALEPGQRVVLRAEGRTVAAGVLE